MQGTAAYELPRIGRGCWYWLRIPFIVLVIIYLGYSWGLWLRDNLLAQALFQCISPKMSETARYAPFEVLISACEEPHFLRISPNQTQLLFIKKSGTTEELHRIDLRSSVQQVVLRDFRGYSNMDFLSDDLALITFGGERLFVLNINTGQLWPISQYGVKQSYPYYRKQVLSRPMNCSETIKL